MVNPNNGSLDEPDAPGPEVTEISHRRRRDRRGGDINTVAGHVTIGLATIGAASGAGCVVASGSMGAGGGAAGTNGSGSGPELSV